MNIRMLLRCTKRIYIEVSNYRTQEGMNVAQNEIKLFTNQG